MSFKKMFLLFGIALGVARTTHAGEGNRPCEQSIPPEKFYVKSLQNGGFHAGIRAFGDCWNPSDVRRVEVVLRSIRGSWSRFQEIVRADPETYGGFRLYDARVGYGTDASYFRGKVEGKIEDDQTITFDLGPELAQALGRNRTVKLMYNVPATPAQLVVIKMR